MNILISQLSQTPIYEQLKNQLRQEILAGNLAKNEMLPSIRGMAKELGIGVITVKRAYDDLCNEGFLVSLQGRGVFVADINTNIEHVLRLERLREQLIELKEYCESSAISKEEVVNIINEIYGGEGSE